MTAVFLIVIAALALTATGAVMAAALYRKRAGKAEAENKTLYEAFWTVEAKAERLQAALGKLGEAEVKAHEERKELAGTPDGGLVDRANNLFGGVPEPPGGSTGSG
jgi:hypothetical protein